MRRLVAIVPQGSRPSAIRFGCVIGVCVVLNPLILFSSSYRRPDATKRISRLVSFRIRSDKLISDVMSGSRARCKHASCSSASRWRFQTLNHVSFPETGGSSGEYGMEVDTKYFRKFLHLGLLSIVVSLLQWPGHCWHRRALVGVHGYFLLFRDVVRHPYWCGSSSRCRLVGRPRCLC